MRYLACFNGFLSGLEISKGRGYSGALRVGALVGAGNII